MSKSLLEQNVNKISKESLYQFYIIENHSKKETCVNFNITMHSLSLLLKNYEIVKPLSLQVEGRKKTNIERYGVDNPSKNDTVIKKIVQTNEQKFGARSFTATEIGKQTVKQTKKLRYGNSNYNNIEQAKETKNERYGNPNYNNREKYKETCKEKFGVDNYFRLKTFIDSNYERLFIKQGYSDLFIDMYTNVDKAKEFLSNKSYTYEELSTLFNCKPYIVQFWVYRHKLQEYIQTKNDGTSSYEKEIVEYIKSLGIPNIITNCFGVLPKQELDIYLPEHKLAIEFNGNYWHSDLFKNKNYHKQKSLDCEKLGIRLIQIYQYEWDDILTREKLKSLLQIACGKVSRKIYARNCVIKNLTNKQAKNLNDSNHLQNHRNAKITYGLYYKDELVQLMSFSKHKTYEWEIIRGCPGSNNIVVGGVEKLFKHFIKEHKPSSVFSYCDFNKFNGVSYERIGMKFIGYTTPDLKYIIDGNVVGRSPHKYKQHKTVFDARIYGSGSKKYLWKCDN